MSLLFRRFLADPQVKRYKDVTHTETIRRAVDDFLAFFESPDTVRRMIESEVHHDRPAIAGVVKDLEALIIEQSIDGFERGEEADWPSPTRRNQLIGVIVRIVMGSKGWKPTGKKGSLAGLSTMFKRGERYAPKNERYALKR